MAISNVNNATQNNTNVASEQNLGGSDANTEANKGQGIYSDNAPVVPGDTKTSETKPLEKKDDTPDKADDSKDKLDTKQTDTEKDTTDKVQEASKTYEAFSVPEGVSINEDTLGQFQTLAKETGLNQENAQKFVDMASTLVGATAKSNSEAWDKVRETWVSDIKADKEYGGDKFNETITRAKRTITKFGSDDFKDFLDTTGYGDNPHLIRMLAKVDKATAEDKTVEGAPSGEGPASLGNIFYPSKG